MHVSTNTKQTMFTLFLFVGKMSQEAYGEFRDVDDLLL